MITARRILRTVHLAAGAAVAPYIYSPTLQANEAYALAVQAVVVPALVCSGLIVWQYPNFRMMFRS
ncbi:MAG: hypothetical protein AAFW98_11150 [Pseudomonadota bacterium]